MGHALSHRQFSANSGASSVKLPSSPHTPWSLSTPPTSLSVDVSFSGKPFWVPAASGELLPLARAPVCRGLPRLGPYDEPGHVLRVRTLHRPVSSLGAG